jgi:hypothetical protein
MSLSNSEMIERLKISAMRRCEERITNAGKGSGIRVEGPIPQFGVTSIMKNRHGL